MNCELILTYDTPALRQAGSRNLTGQKTLPMIWGTYMKLVVTSFIYVCLIVRSVFGPVRFLLPVCRLSWFLYTLNIYRMHIFRHIFLSNYWWQRSDIWSQASYRYPISWEAFLNPSDSYFLFADCWFLYTLNIHFVYAHFYSHFSQRDEKCAFYIYSMCIKTN
jgi:hypothetical protein